MTTQTPKITWQTSQILDEETDYYHTTIGDQIDLIIVPVPTIPPNDDTWYLQIHSTEGDDLLGGIHYQGPLTEAKQDLIDHLHSILNHWIHQLRPSTAIPIESSQCHACFNTWQKSNLTPCPTCQQKTCPYCLLPDEDGNTSICQACADNYA